MKSVTDSFFDQMSLRLIIGNYNTCAPDWGETSCCYAYHKFYYFTGGSGTLVIDGISWHPEPGELCYIPAGTVHTYYHDHRDPVIQYWCHFDMSLGRSRRTGFTQKTLFCRPDETAVVSHFEKILARDVQNPAFQSLNEQIGLSGLLLLFLQSVDYRQILISEKDNITAVIRPYIESHLRDTIYLEDLAELLHLQPNYFIQYCRKHTGMTPIELVHSIKLKMAAGLLADSVSPLPVSDIAWESGFRDYRYFSRLFKRTYGVTPSVYRGLRH